MPAAVPGCLIKYIIDSVPSTQTYDWTALTDFLSFHKIELSAEQRVLIEKFLNDLIDYNAKVNLTADAQPNLLLTRHVADALFAVKCLRETLSKPVPTILDLGAGGGLIGLPLKIVWPEAEVTLMESSRRKYDFLNFAAVRLGLKGLRVSRERGETFHQQITDAGFDAIIARALAPLPEALIIGFHLLSPAGYFAVYQSDMPDPQSPELSKVLALHSARLVKSWAYRLPGEDKDRYFVMFAPSAAAS